jgi:ferredoxin
VTTVITVEMDRCAGHGMCLLLLGERVSLDRWGYPVVDTSPMAGRRAARRAARAVRACPQRALRLVPEPKGGS